MSAEKKYTEHQLLLAQRAAVQVTVAEMFRLKPLTSIRAWEGSQAMARRLYPIRVTKVIPRVVKDAVRHWQYRAMNGAIECRWGGMGGFNDEWGPVTRTLERLDVTAARIALWADLLANPTEEVEVDE